MEESADRPPTLSGELDDRLRRQPGDPWQALLGLVASPDPESAGLPLRLHGKLLGGVRLLRILGTGGMGVAYEGVDGNGERVAVKVFGQLSDVAALRFENECRILATLHHPNIVRYRTHGVTTDEGAYLVMDFVAGTDLEHILVALESGEPLDDVGETLVLGIEPESDVHRAASYRRRVVRLLATVADALHHAHEAGVVHRDVKPANIVVRDDLSPVLIDFGLGRDLFRELSWTRSGAVVGTVGWMAPEQLDGDLDAVGPRTDVFAVGLVLHRALTGRELRRNLKDLDRFRRGALRLSSAERADLDAGLLGVLYGCLEPRPERRYASAKDLAEDLRAYVAGTPTTRRGPGVIARTYRETWGKVLAVLCAALVLAPVLIKAWPRTSSVSIMLLEDDQNGRLTYADGTPLDLVLPLHDWQVPLGSVFDLVYRTERLPGLQIPIHVEADQEFVRVNVLHVTPGRVPELGKEIGLAGGPDDGLIDVVTRVAAESCRIDGVDHPLTGGGDPGFSASADDPPILRARVRVRPGVHEVQVRAPWGGTHRQSVSVSPTELEAWYAFTGRLREVRGSVRIEWANVLSTPPPGVHVHLDGVAGAFMDGKAEARGSSGWDLGRGEIYLERNVGLAPLAAGREAEVMLSVSFERPMRSLIAAFTPQCNSAQGCVLRIEYSIDDGPWISRIRFDATSKHQESQEYWIEELGPFSDRGRIPIDLSGLPAPGIRVLRIRCVMTSRQASETTSFVRFLPSYANSVSNIEPAFELVADPDPAPRRTR